ncbi:hypothetical protein QTQ03_06385 [Micromonospora sp. WMMA1363]|uniref:hypothetical protein n=1 Tax=Micromonospora sp. WMMA1363 TaxID=3053985 RepID=UPI00259CCF4E|nr:hypothetical protein [Micromonospora sp. WMMA1363]MDM4719243.1 hypothetical protein [Micromonospora sp. WMMA1363]
MKRMTPMLTLASGTALAAGLFTMSAQAAPPAPTPAADAGQASPTPPAADAAAPTATGSAEESTGAPALPGAQPGATSPPPSTPGPTPGTTAGDGTWTGRLGTGATIALTVRQGRAVAYVCDGRHLEIWLRGAVTDGELALRGADGARLTGTIDGDRVSGEVRAADERWAFTATEGTSPALYRATAQVRDAGVDGGWILLADGTQVGVVTWNRKPVQAPPLDPAFGTTVVNGIAITAVPVVPEPGPGR